MGKTLLESEVPLWQRILIPLWIHYRYFHGVLKAATAKSGRMRRLRKPRSLRIGAMRAKLIDDVKLK
jgi:hypothetical protein